ncbi:MAG: isochorismatase family protein [Pseudomonadota bacterium]
MPRQTQIVGRAALMVTDIRKRVFMDVTAGIPVMPGYRDTIELARGIADTAHACDIPGIFFQEIHRRTLIDYGPGLGGSEDIHCLEGGPGTPVASEEMGRAPGDYVVHKRRYSCFFGTETEILRKGLKAETMILDAGMTDVCVHSAFVEGDQHDCRCCVVIDCVGSTSPEAHQAELTARECLQAGAETLIAAMSAEKIAAE